MGVGGQGKQIRSPVMELEPTPAQIHSKSQIMVCCREFPLGLRIISIISPGGASRTTWTVLLLHKEDSFRGEQLMTGILSLMKCFEIAQFHRYKFILELIRKCGD